jgi:hypothetical protein
MVVTEGVRMTNERGRWFDDGTAFVEDWCMPSEEHQSQAGNLDRRAAQKRAARRAARRRLEAGESPAALQAENSAVRPGSFTGARIANLWQAVSNTYESATALDPSESGSGGAGLSYSSTIRWAQES